MRLRSAGLLKGILRPTKPPFGIRTSAFLRTSDFGFRILPLPLWLLATQSLLAATTNPSSPDTIPPLRPPHAEIPPTFWEQHGTWVVACGVVLLLVLSAAVWLLVRPRSPVVVAPELAVRRALAPLRKQVEDGALLSQVSQLLRRYVTAAFNLPPEELTTAEFCSAIANHAQIGPELSAALSDFLHQCDQRKFAPAAPASPLGAVAQALNLIDQAQARLATAAQPQK